MHVDLSRDTLIKLYWEEKLSLKKIGTMFGLSASGVQKKFIKLDIPRRVNDKNKFDSFRKIKLTNEQLEIVVGSVLGDGYLESSYNKGVRLRIKHSLKQVPYLEFKRNRLDTIFVSQVREISQFRFGKMLYAREYVSITHPDLLSIYRRFYPKSKKIVPVTIEQDLSPLVLAIWYMDDGTYCKCKSNTVFRLSTESFSYDKNVLLSMAIESRYGIKLHVHKHKDKFVLQSGKRSSIDSFFNIINPFVEDLILTCKGKSSTTIRLASQNKGDEDIV